jgi:T5SS/PEP-CTERM-associated repeat protein
MNMFAVSFSLGRCLGCKIFVASLSILLVLASCHTSFAAVTGTADFFPSPPVDMSSLQVGTNGYGTLRIDGGSTFNSSSVGIGSSNSGFGRATVTDPGSIWTMSNLSIGQGGVGQLEVSNGGVAIINSTTFLGTSSSGKAEVTVTGAGSLLQFGSQISVGESGNGKLTIADDAFVNVPNSQTRIGGAGQLQFKGGLLRTDYLENRGIISGNGSIEVSCCGTNFNYGRIQVNPGDHLEYRSFSNFTSQNYGDILIYGGEIEHLSRLQNNVQGNQRGLIELSDGVLRTGQVGSEFGEPQLANRGLLAAVAGENHVYGTVRNEFDGDIVVTNNSQLMFHHDVVGYSNSTISVSAGSNAIFLQDLTLNGGTLLADLTGTAGFGHVEVIGDFQFFGSLEVHVAEGFSPQLGDTFPLATVTGTITGTPNLDQLPSLTSGLAWEVQTDDYKVVLAVTAAPPLPGDFDSDNDVDGRDFLAWQRDPNVGSLGEWQENYDSTEGLATVVTVPEPAFAGLLAACLGTIAMARSTNRES